MATPPLDYNLMAANSLVDLPQLLFQFRDVIP